MAPRGRSARTRWRTRRTSVPVDDDQLDPVVDQRGALVRRLDDRLRAAETADLEALAVDAPVHEPVADRGGALLRDLQVARRRLRRLHVRHDPQLEDVRA